MILDAGVAFKKNWRRDYNRDEVSLGSQVSKSDAEKIKHRVADEFKKVFTAELEKAGYEVADYDVNLAEDDILVLRPAIVDLVVTAPDTMSAGRSRSYTASAGAMTCTWSSMTRSPVPFSDALLTVKTHGITA